MMRNSESAAGLYDVIVGFGAGYYLGAVLYEHL
ncbi:hypothetical protein Y888_21030 [Mixta calida B021323]|nr:hypothetical protein Y888_21030 [Mixta calida B021323]